MSTKEKIVFTALQLFNAQGVDAVTTRHIAQAMGISHGNVCYHFAKKEDIIYILYQNLVKELDEEIVKLQTGAPSLEMMMQATVLTFTIQYKYKFLLLDMVGIMRRIEPIRINFKKLFLQRKAQFLEVINYLIAQGLLKKEPVAGQYERFIIQFYIIGDFWISEAEILFEGKPEEKIKFYTNAAFSMFIPYFTAEGRQAYKRLHLFYKLH